jgi:S-formylglutathione hydrolase
MTLAFTTRSEHRSFEGVQGFYEHHSELCRGPMRFSVFVPPEALRGQAVPVIYYLPGLTCTDETFPTKAQAQRHAAERSVILVSCDTSPRTVRVPGDDADWDFGQGAGFYLDASLEPWASAGYRMQSYVTRELRTLVEASFPVKGGVRGIMGHSMGGHGALTIALKHVTEYQSVSALAPIVAPSQVPWGQKAFRGYLGEDAGAWAEHDTLKLLEKQRFPGTLLVDQGAHDKFLERELRPELLAAACEEAGQPLELRMHAGYDHSYYFVSTFIEDHIAHHADALWAAIT